MEGQGPQGPPDQQPRQAAPDWYPDPQVPGRLRYWDGSQWTEHVHHQQALQPQAQPAWSPPAGPPPQGGSRPWYKRTWVIVTGSIIALLIVAGALGGQEQPSDPSSGGQSGQAKQPAEPAQPQAKKSGCSATPGKPNQATESCAPRVGPGKKVTVDGLVYSVLSVKTAKSLGNPTIGTDERAAGTFVIVQLSVHSTKNEAVTLTGDTVKLVARGAAVLARLGRLNGGTPIGRERGRQAVLPGGCATGHHHPRHDRL